MVVKNSKFVVGVLVLIIVLVWVMGPMLGKIWENISVPAKKIGIPQTIPVATPSTSIKTASPSASPTPKKLSFTEMNALYGPCVSLPVLMYHHVESPELALANKRTGLNVPPDTFRKQMEYLKAKGYISITPNDLINFFDNGVRLPNKAILLTFDDGYVDNGDNAFPILRDNGFKATIYLPTGLMENYDYLTWAKINEMKISGVINFGNHTWSHRNVGGNKATVTKEISTADTQLADHGLNEVKTFAYPYGIETSFAEKLLSSMGYKLAFTTVPGRTMCKQKRFDLPRIRIGNSSLSVYGL